MVRRTDPGVRGVCGPVAASPGFAPAVLASPPIVAPPTDLVMNCRLEIFCFTPFSKSSKSSMPRPVTTLPFLSVTVTSTWMRSVEIRTTWSSGGVPVGCCASNGRADANTVIATRNNLDFITVRLPHGRALMQKFSFGDESSQIYSNGQAESTFSASSTAGEIDASNLNLFRSDANLFQKPYWFVRGPS